MQIRQEFKEHFHQIEGVRYKPYKDSRGIWTVGCGRNLETGLPVPAHIQQKLDAGEDLTDADVDELLTEDIEAAVVSCRRLYTDFDEIEVSRQEALVDFVFNLGETGAGGFPSMRRAVNDRNWDRAADEAGLNSAGDGPSRWVQQTGVRAERIIRILRNG